jgi:RHS repeat-associated protein/MYXO-CTERM domain-containing protein
VRTYDSAGRVTSLTYPDEEQITQTYWDTGAQTNGLLASMDSVTYGDRYVGSTVYTTDGLQLDTLNLGTSPTTTLVDYGYDNRGRLTGIVGGSTQNLSYTYDNVGNLKTITDNSAQPAEATTFAYDGLNRLTGASGGYSASYTYSPNGQLRTKQEQYTYSLGYNDPAHKHAATVASSTNGSFSMSYDANGNLTQRSGASVGAVGGIAEAPDALATPPDSGPPVIDFVIAGGVAVAVLAGAGLWRKRRRGAIILLLVLAVPLLAEQATETHAAPATLTGAEVYTYDAENRLASRWDGVHTTMYTYDGQGNLVKRWSNDGTSTIYIGGIYEKNSGGSWIDYYNAFGRTIALRKHSGPSDPGAVYYLLADHLGSTTLVLDSAGTPVKDGNGNPIPPAKYYPYGDLRPGTGPVALTDKKFTGQQEEGTSFGLYDYGARFYSSVTGRFLSGDPHSQPADPQMLDRYSYVRNKPVAFVDPTGLDLIIVCGTQQECEGSNVRMDKIETYKMFVIMYWIQHGMISGANAEAAWQMFAAYIAYGHDPQSQLNAAGVAFLSTAEDIKATPFRWGYVRKLRGYVESNPDVDTLIGFSQGGWVVAAFLGEGNRGGVKGALLIESAFNILGQPLYGEVPGVNVVTWNGTNPTVGIWSMEGTVKGVPNMVTGECQQQGHCSHGKRPDYVWFALLATRMPADEAIHLGNAMNIDIARASSDTVPRPRIGLPPEPGLY